MSPAFARRLRIVTYVCALCVTLGCAHVGDQRVARSSRPNIIIILADDMGYGDLNCQNPQSKIPTPNLDLLASQGIRFTDAHSPSAVCTPTRYSLLTGEYAWRSRLKQSVLWEWDRPLIGADTLTLPGMLQIQGYATACIGKWHLGWDWPTLDGRNFAEGLAASENKRQFRLDWNRNVDFSKPVLGGPTSRGFDNYFGDDVPNFPPYAFIENDRVLGSPAAMKPKEMFGNPGLMTEGWDLTEVMPAILEKSVEYIKQARDEPFFLYMPLTAPHTPIAPSAEFIGKSDAHRYGDFVNQVDWTVGQIMQALEESGQSENTLTIFTSDNGSPHRSGENMGGGVGSVLKYGHNPSGLYRGTKADIWEGGHRVPFIAKWPGRIREGGVNDETICHVDLMATCAAIVGADLTADSAIDSSDLSALLLDRPNTKFSREAVVHHSINGMFAIRDGKWKLIEGQGSGGWTKSGKDASVAGQLYDLDADPGEMENVYATFPEVVERLQGLLNEIRASDRRRDRYSRL